MSRTVTSSGRECFSRRGAGAQHKGGIVAESPAAQHNTTDCLVQSQFPNRKPKAASREVISIGLPSIVDSLPAIGHGRVNSDFTGRLLCRRLVGEVGVQIQVKHKSPLGAGFMERSCELFEIAPESCIVYRSE